MTIFTSLIKLEKERASIEPIRTFLISGETERRLEETIGELLPNNAHLVTPKFLADNWMSDKYAQSSVAPQRLLLL